VNEWLAGGAALVALHPKVRARWALRRQRLRDLDGTPPRIENGRTVDPGRPSLAAAVRDLSDAVTRIDLRTEQLARNGGVTIADAIHRIEQRVIDAAGKAGEAATSAAASDMRVRELAANLDTWVNVAANDNADIWQALSEAGLDRREER
jgi:hypothetical protein